MLDVLKFKKEIAAGILDGGDNSIFLGDDKFKQFMKSVESVTAGLPALQTDAESENERATEQQMAALQQHEQEEIVPEEETAKEKTAATTPAALTPEAAIVEKGIGFFEGLLQVMSNPESTQRLVNSITETDAATGQTYLKIPVSSNGVVENALKLLGGLLGGLNGKK